MANSVLQIRLWSPIPWVVLNLTDEILTAYTASIASCLKILLFLIFVFSVLDFLKFEDHISCMHLPVIIFFWGFIFKRKNSLIFQLCLFPSLVFQTAQDAHLKNPQRHSAPKQSRVDHLKLILCSRHTGTCVLPLRMELFEHPKFLQIFLTVTHNQSSPWLAGIFSFPIKCQILFYFTVTAVTLLSFAEWERSQPVLLKERGESLRKEQFGAVLTKIQS